MPWAVSVAHGLVVEASFLADALSCAPSDAAQAERRVRSAIADAAPPPLPAASPPAGCGSATSPSSPPHVLHPPPFPAALSPHSRPPAPPRPGGGASLAWARLLSQGRVWACVSCRARRGPLCEPHSLRCLSPETDADAAIGCSLAALLPGGAKARCGSCGDGSEAHIRAFAAAGRRVQLRVRPTGVPTPPGCVWTWDACTAPSCAAASPSSPRGVRVLLSPIAASISLSSVVRLTLTAPALTRCCGHPMHGPWVVRFFALPTGTVALSSSPFPRLALRVPPTRIAAPRGAGGAAFAAEADALGAAGAAGWASVRASLASSRAEHAPRTRAGDPPVLASELAAAAGGEEAAWCARLREAAASADPFALNRARRALSLSIRRWGAATAELGASHWRSSFPVDARRGWGEEGVAAHAAPPPGGAAPHHSQPQPNAAGEAPAAPPPATQAAPPAHPQPPPPPLLPHRPPSLDGVPVPASPDAAAPAPPSSASSAPSSSAPAAPSACRPLLPFGPGGAAVVIWDDEPTSVIAYALGSASFASSLSAARAASQQHAPLPPPRPLDSAAAAALASAGVAWSVVASPCAAHVRVSISDRSDRFVVTSYFAPQFGALHRLWGLASPRLLRSLCRCARWDAGAGKSGALFAKTRDGCLLLKALSRPELAALLDFAPSYCAYAAASAASESPVLLAKLVGVFTIHTSLHGRRESKLDCVVMENLLAGEPVGPVFDLKGAAGRSRAAPGGASVLLDDNLAERAAADAPLALSLASSGLLSGAVWRDTAFLASLGVMDYSLLAAVAPRSGSLVVGIVDYLRTYTWDKQLETVVKSVDVKSVLAGASQALPTVISPAQYARRFRKAMCVRRLRFAASPAHSRVTQAHRLCRRAGARRGGGGCRARAGLRRSHGCVTSIDRNQNVDEDATVRCTRASRTNASTSRCM